MTAETILAAMLALPPYYGDRAESLAERTALYRPVAEAIYEVSKESKNAQATAAMLISQGFEETKYARYVLEGRCSDGPPGQRCDNGRSRGAFQVGRWCPLDHGPLGEARCALRAARYGAAHCRQRSLTPWHGAFAGLAARDCSWPQADRRVATMRRIMVML